MDADAGLPLPPTPPQTQFLADQLTLFSPEGADYDYHFTTDTSKFLTFRNTWIASELKTCYINDKTTIY